MTETTRWWRPSLATRRKNDAWVRQHPVLYGLIWGCVMAIVYFGVNFAVDGRPFTSPKHLVGLAVGAIVGGLVSGLAGGALMARWVKRH
jgi:hypothetical protein